METQLIKTEDGSHTLFVPGLNEHYHSIHGAVTESRHVFVKNGLSYILQDLQKIYLLEVGFGTGLNALLTYFEAKKNNIFIDYVGIEPFSLSKEVYSNLNFPDLIGDKTAEDVFKRMHETALNERHVLSPFFNFKIMGGGLEECKFVSEKFHLVFFDAFSPDVQPELWTELIFAKVFEVLKKGGVLVTYSAKGSVRRAMKNVGFRIERLPGPPGKREMLRGEK